MNRLHWSPRRRQRWSGHCRLSEKLPGAAPRERLHRELLPQAEEGAAASRRGATGPVGLRHAFPSPARAPSTRRLPARRPDPRPAGPPAQREASLQPPARAPAPGQGQGGRGRGDDASAATSTEQETAALSQQKVPERRLHHGAGQTGGRRARRGVGLRQAGR